MMADNKQRVKMMEKLLASGCSVQRQCFFNRTAMCGGNLVNNNLAVDSSTTPSRPVDSHITYLRRLNGESKSGNFIENTAKKSSSILMPCLIPPDEQNSEVFYTLTHDFFSHQRDPQWDDLPRHSVMRFVFYLLDIVFSSDGGDTAKNNALLTRIAMDLYDLSQLFLEKVAAVRFNPVAHEYHVNGNKMDLSVTKSLDQLFDIFNEENAADRMVRSRNWARNRLFNTINYDESGNQRDKETMCRLIKQEWKRRRDPTVDNDIGPDDDTLIRGNASGRSPDRLAKSTMENFCKCKSNDKKHIGYVADAVSVPALIDSRALSLWKKLRLRFANIPSYYQPAAKESRDTNSTSSTVAIEDINSRCQPGANLASIDLLDKANVSAFMRWNRVRLNDHWLLLASEYTVYDEQSGLAGTIDAIFLPYPHRTDMVVLVDWKRCEIDFGTRYYGPNMRYEHDYTQRYPKCNYWKYAFQLNVYREMLERAHGGRLIVVDMMIVNFLPDSEFPRTFSVPRIAETRLFLDDLRARKEKAKIVSLDSVLACGQRSN